MPAGRDVELSIQSNDVIHSFWIPALNGKKDAVPGRTHSLVLQAWEPGIYQGQCTEFCGLSHGVMRMQVKALSADDYAEWIDMMTAPPAQPDDELAQAGQELFVQQCASCHQVNGVEPGVTTVEYAELPDPEYGQSVDSPLLSKNAPNLTHLMMRDTFAGSLLDLYEEPATPVVENPSTPNTNNLKRWLRNPEDIKPMDPANGQGMPNLGLSEEQIDQLVAYLTTLK
jgi:cytochrome c oxidase subunit 2